MHNARVLTIAMLLATAASSRSLAAQTGVVTGTVFRDSLGHELGAVDVTFPGLGRSGTANYRGEFRFERLPAGRHVIVFRHVGFAALSDTVVVRDSSRTDLELTMVPQVVQLDSVRVVTAARTYISPALREFEERRKAGFGHFIDEAELRKNDDHLLVDLISSRMPGLKRFRVTASGELYVGSTRKCGSGPAIMTCSGPSAYCPATLYVDGVRVFDSVNMKDARDIPDLRSFPTNQYAAVEYCAGGATVPARFNATSSGCGVLLLWSRER